MTSHSNHYLSRLPEQFRYLGNYKSGEIEIATDSEVIGTVQAKLRSKSIASSESAPQASETGIVFEDDYILVIRDPVIFKNGQAGTYLRIIERASLTGKAGVVMLPVRDNLVYLNKIFRHATRHWELECPRGYREESQTLEEAVEAELSQELGLEIDAIYNLGEVYSNTGLLAGSAQAYFVRLKPGDAAPCPEEGESISDTVTLTTQEVKAKIRSGEIRDGFTLSVLQLAQAHDLLTDDRGI
ncbi:NUDIX hydrolase [Leptolyngbya boryana NIES-2135]|jgi:ADP-ribose pyrophosphatase|uniref:NUDIX hydrolase n=1 Tax=Leptolyngbya boryana NIES-2135 TaxID=1973484 RepID=A0A1Z4JK87_LEPBY|nr:MULTISPECIES: NUDIX hydrolase [Leptolyngbya]BAY56997.1 NUDIX hydrolase [Leptolyngbya boryana NIES-2135]MBD2371385.1 NUDIX hydrolase [Leptolyngbya sp. FACHB-161]MBD2377888.1 NUDIX hydrolase [Leptolyngbya sp. FACHB-238]MBD2402328.1 NUDIX hydrolase [Leptolyngbya sp. FACHB-239]MBD2408819.1 NUDIX hydrolase [Leptolyngbya sp. FACHB-402]